MHYGLKLINGPQEEPVTVEELKAHLRINTSTEDVLLAGYITAARELIERYTNRQIMEADWSVLYDDWQIPLLLPKAPLVEVVAVTYWNEVNEDAIELGADDYLVDDTAEPARIFPIDRFPTVDKRRQPAIQVDFTAGYVGYNQPPRLILQAVLLLAAHYYTFREAVVPTLGALREIPYGLQSVVHNFKVWV